MNRRKTFDWAAEQESCLRDKIGDNIFDALDAMEKTTVRPVKPRHPGYVFLDRAFFPFTGYERMPTGYYKLQVPRLKFSGKTHHYSTRMKEYIVPQSQIKWSQGYEGNIV